MRGDVAGGQTAGIQRQNDLIDVGQPPLPLRHDHRLEVALTIPGHFDGDLTRVGQHRLGAFPVWELPRFRPSGSCLMPLWTSSGPDGPFLAGDGLSEQQRVELACDVSLEASQRFSLGLPLCNSSLQVSLRARIPAHARQGDPVDGRVGSSIAAAAEPASARVPRRRLDRAHTAQRRERPLRTQTIRIVTDGDQQRGRGVGPKPVTV